MKYFVRFISALGVVLAIIMSMNAFEASLVPVWGEAAASALIAASLLIVSQVIMENHG